MGNCSSTTSNTTIKSRSKKPVTASTTTTTTQYVGLKQAPIIEESLEHEFQRKMHQNQVNLIASVKPLLQKKDSMMYNFAFDTDRHAQEESVNKATKKQRDEEHMVAAMQESAADKSWVVSRYLVVGVCLLSSCCSS